ncbi:proline transporter 2-like [Silene latifolia]|uniref:proline transporter 2-like n=1 Tax=Silene latifolia TaxID=37657 RepID=UPI003D77F91C
MESQLAGMSTTPAETFNIEQNGAMKDDEHLAEVSASAHSVGHDSWQQVGLMVATCYNCGWILSFSNLMFVPLGWGWGIPGLFLVGLFTWYTSWLLAGFHFIDGQRFIRFKDMIRHLFGKEMYYVTWISQSAILILGNMGFILLGGRGLKEINLMFSDSPMRLQYFIIITGITYFIFSSIVPNMSAIRVWLGASAILTFGYIGVVLVIVVKDGRIIGKSNSHRNYEVKGNMTDKVLNAFGAISAILVCNAPIILPEIQATLRKPAVKNMRRVLIVQYTAGLMVYYGVSILGYWAYGSAVSDYLPTVLSGPKWAKVLINLIVFLQNIISQHVFLQPVHEALDTKFLKHDEGIYSKGNLKGRLLLRLLLFTGCTLVAAALPFIGYFINLLGSFTLVWLTFILPSMIFIKVKGKTARVEQKAWHWTIIFVSSLLAVATTVSAFRLIVLNIKNYNFFANQ